MTFATVKWFGKRPSPRAKRSKVMDMVTEYTSEHAEDFTVLGMLTESESNTTIGFEYNKNLFVAAYSDDFVLIFEDNVLNIAVLISLWDQKVFTYEQMEFVFDITSYLR